MAALQAARQLFIFLAETASVQSLHGLAPCRGKSELRRAGCRSRTWFKAGGSGASRLSQRVQQKANRSGSGWSKGEKGV